MIDILKWFPVSLAGPHRPEAGLCRSLPRRGALWGLGSKPGGGGGWDGPASGLTGPPQNRQARLGMDGPTSGLMGPTSETGNNFRKLINLLEQCSIRVALGLESESLTGPLQD